MDSGITSAARALSAGDPVGALSRVALRDDPAALALRGIAMAQLGDYDRARALLRRAARSFTARERLERARCVVAEAEIALAARDLRGSPRALDEAASALEALGDERNAIHARLIAARRATLLGRLDEAERAVAGLDPSRHPMLAARAELTRAELALRRIRVAEASAALDRAGEAAHRARIPALIGEIERARQALVAPAARAIASGSVRAIRLHEVESVLASGDLVIDACRRAIRGPHGAVGLARRPILFAIARALGEAWPGDVPRDRLIASAFEARVVNASHRARLRVEVGRLRAALRGLSRVEATAAGYALVASDALRVIVLAPPVDGPAGAILALLDDGEAWSTSALATALGGSQRTVQRALRELDASGAVRSIGQARSRRWLARTPDGFATTLLLPGALPVE